MSESIETKDGANDNGGFRADCATDNEIVPVTIVRTIFMTMDTGVKIDHVKLKDASARRNYDEKFFIFGLKVFTSRAW